jgi:methionyl-tRNA formyltransferase
MKIVFVGMVEFSLQMLKHLVDNKIEIEGVVTTKKNNFNTDFVNLIPFCKQNNIPVLLTTDINEIETINWIKKYQPDVILCMGWSRLIKKQLLNIPSIGVIGYHPAALPKNRGRHPIIWALALGLSKTGSSFFFMDEGADSGDIISTEDIMISKEDNARTLYNKIIATAKQQILSVVMNLRHGEYSKIPQDNTLANTWRKRGMKDGEIDWRISAGNIYNLIRALTRPYVGAHFIKNDHEYKVWDSRVILHSMYENIEAGKVIDITNCKNLIVKCGNDCIELLDVDPILDINIGDYL